MKAKTLLLTLMLILPNLLLSGSMILEESFQNLRDKKGWHILTGKVTGDHGVVWKTHTNGLELQRDVVSVSADGEVHAELDAKHNVKISTKVTPTDATKYKLSFNIKPRAKNNNKETSAMSVKLFGKVLKINANQQGQLLVKNNNESVKVFQTPQDNGWSRVEIDYNNVDKSKNTLLFRGTGTDDSYGMLLDTVKLIAKDANDTQENNQTTSLPEGVILKESFENLRDKKGWHILKGNLKGDHGVVWKTDTNGLELQRGIISSSGDGKVHAELDAKHNVKISTKVTPTDANEYTLHFAIKPRGKKGDKSTSAIRINLFKQIVNIRSSSSGELSVKNKNDNVQVTQTLQDNGWSKIEINYSDINKSQNALVIRGIGTDDSYGMLLDDIVLSAKDANGTEEPESIVLNSLTLTSSNTTLTVGDTTTLSVTAHYSDGTTKNITNNATFNSSNTQVASISGSILSTLAKGSTNITATLDGVTSNGLSVTVEAKPITLTSIILTSNSTILEVDDMTDLSVMANYSDGSNKIVTDATFNSSNTQVAVITSSTLIALTEGSTLITASFNGITSNNLNITIEPKSIKLVDLIINIDSDILDLGDSMTLTTIGLRL